MKPKNERKRSATIWATPNCTENQVVEATKLYARLTNPKYLKAERLGKTFIEYIVQKRIMTTISGTDVLAFLVEEKVPGHERRDLANMIMDFLKEYGYTVWRS